jgi:nucleotide-binding universal stress UspA family protein
LSDRRELVWMVYIGLGAGILALAFLRNQFRKQDQLEAKLVDSAAQVGTAPGSGSRVLVPVDGSRNVVEALRKFTSGIDPKAQPEIHLLNVRGRLSRHVAGFLRRSDVAAWQRDEGMKALKGAMALLTERGLRFAHHVREGDKARTIADVADELACDQIVMATARRNSLTRIVEDSVTARVLELTRVPVEVIPGTSSSRIESIAVPACMSMVVVLLISMTLLV